MKLEVGHQHGGKHSIGYRWVGARTLAGARGRPRFGLSQDDGTDVLDFSGESVTTEEVAALIPYLQYFAEHGELPDHPLEDPKGE